MRATAVIAAAGHGTRIGGPASKLYLPVNGRAVLLHTLDRFAAVRSIEDVIVVVAAGDLGEWRRVLGADPEAHRLRWRLEAGGPTRQESVRLGLARVSQACEVVVIHDGARPFVSPALIERCVGEARKRGAVVAGIPVRDTIKAVSAAGIVQGTMDRAVLWEIQTPQAFRRELITAAHLAARSSKEAATDDAALVERLGEPVYVIEGERTNIKITVPEDLCLAEALMRGGRLPWLSAKAGEEGSS